MKDQDYKLDIRKYGEALEEVELGQRSCGSLKMFRIRLTVALISTIVWFIVSQECGYCKALSFCYTKDSLHALITL